MTDDGTRVVREIDLNTPVSHEAFSVAADLLMHRLYLHVLAGGKGAYWHTVVITTEPGEEPMHVTMKASVEVF